MSDLTLSLKALATEFQDEIVESQFMGAPELKLISVVQGGGPNCSWAISVDGYSNGATTLAEGGDLASFSASTDLQATLAWARYFESRRVTGTLLAAARSSSSPAGNADQILRNLRAANKDVCSAIGTALYTGSGATDNICGFDVAFHDHNTYAGVNRATAANHPFDSNLTDPGVATALTEAQIMTDIDGIVLRCGRKPSFALTSHAVVRKVASLLGALRNFDIPVQGALGQVVFNGGYDAILVSGVPLIATPNAPISSSTSHSIYYVQQDDVELVMQDPMGRMAMGYEQLAGEDSAGALPIPMLFRELAGTTDALPFAVLAECQLVVRNPGSCGVRRNVNPTIS